MSSSSPESVSALYEQLRQLARHRLSSGLGGESLQATALVHEVWIKLADAERVTFRDRSHYHAVAAQAMRWILVDHARRRSAARRSRVTDPVPVEDVADSAAQARDAAVLDLEAALAELERHAPRKAEVVMMRHFAGLSVEETAAALELSPATVKREWQFARAWLLQRLDSGPDPKS